MSNVPYLQCLRKLRKFYYSGCLDEAEKFINGMVIEPDAYVWRAFLGACRIHNNMELANNAADHLLDMEVNDAGIYILLANIYAVAERWI